MTISVLSALSNLGGPVGKLVGKVGSVVGDLGMSAEEKRRMELDGRKLDLEELKLRGEADAQQVKVNLVEASSSRLFVAGWRPFVGWVCGVALAWHYIIADLVAWAAALWAPGVEPPVLVGTSELVTILLGMLGLGGLRTWEKSRKLSK